MSKETAARTPPARPSDEAKEAGLRLAKEQGDAFARTVEYMTSKVAQLGGKQRAGDYLIGYAVEKAEGMYERRGGQLEWQEPGDENIHIEVVVCDGSDGRFIPGLSVQATVIDAGGKTIGTHEQPFLWHPYLFHYGRNWRVPGDGEYTLRVRVEPPTFPRHDKINGKRFAEPVEVEFTDVKMKTGHG